MKFKRIVMYFLIIVLILFINLPKVNADVKQRQVVYAKENINVYNTNTSDKKLVQVIGSIIGGTSITINPSVKHNLSVRDNNNKVEEFYQCFNLKVGGIEIRECYVRVTDISESNSGTNGDNGQVSSEGQVSVTTKASPSSNPLKDLSDEGALDDYKVTDIKNANTLKKKANIIIGVLQAIGTVTSVIMLTVLGIKYMIGSIEEKAEYKKSMTLYVVGASTILVVSNLVAIIYNIAQGLNS